MSCATLWDILESTISPLLNLIFTKMLMRHLLCLPSTPNTPVSKYQAYLIFQTFHKSVFRDWEKGMCMKKEIAIM